MDYNYLQTEITFHEWNKYWPMEGQYIRYAGSNPSIIAAAHKISDVYYAYASARASFIYSFSENFGDISGDNEKSKLYAKTHFLTNALLEYAICLDISWQVIWAYIQPTSLEYLMKQKYKEMEKECNRDSVIEQLKCIISQNSYGVSIAQNLLDNLNEFDNDTTTLELRSLYNKIKHQGIIHFNGLGINPSKFCIAVNGKTPKMLHRKSYSVEEIEELLFEYHKKFKKYIDVIISLIMPSDYFESNKIDISSAFGEIVAMDSASK